MNTNLKLGLIMISMLTLCFGGATLATGCDAVKDALGDGGVATDGGGTDTDGGGVCTAVCTDKACGDADGCGGKCAGTCDTGKTCKQGVCVDDSCTAACTGKFCGEDDGCGTKCTDCETAGETCNEDTWECEAGGDACTTCVSAACGTEYNACLSNIDCVKIYQCVGACTDDTCRQACYVDNVDGQADYDTVSTCAMTECPDECGGACTPTCGADSCGEDDGCGDYCYDCSGDNMSCNTTTWTCEDLGSCGDVTFAGCCAGAVATFCEGGAVQTIDCSENTDPAKQACGWAAATDLGDIYDCGGAGETHGLEPDRLPVT